MATIDQQFVEYIVKTLVSKPDKVVVDRKIDEKGVLLSLTVDPEDIGRVIGKRGVTAQSLRMLLRALGTKQDARYNLKIINSDEDGETTSHERKHREDWHDTEPTVVEEVKESVGVEPADDYDDTEEAENTDDSRLAEKTRAEMADLDDLDI